MRIVAHDEVQLVFPGVEILQQALRVNSTARSRNADNNSQFLVDWISGEIWRRELSSARVFESEASIELQNGSWSTCQEEQGIDVMGHAVADCSCGASPAE